MIFRKREGCFFSTLLVLMEKTNENKPSTGKSNFSSISTPSPDKGADSIAIQIPQISLPKGGGAIKGVDEKFEVNAANGTASLSLPLPFSPGRNGFMPAIALGYNSGSGNGLFGLGWDLGYPSIQRKTDKRLPRYRDGEESDTFMFSGVEDLVPVLLENGAIDEFPSGNYRIRRYRPRIEGGFSRIEKITNPDHGVWWKVTTRDNLVTFFGKNIDYRIADPANKDHVFQWLPELSYDDKGNCVLYEFKTEDGYDYGKALHDANRFTAQGAPRFTNRYLKRVFYTPRSPFLSDFDQPDHIYRASNPTPDDFLMNLVFDYGEHGKPLTEAQGSASVSYMETNHWPARHDAFSFYRAGFEIRTARLCRRVLMFHHFAELDSEPCLVRSLDLQYRDWFFFDEPEQGKKLEVTYLVAATQRSYVLENNGQYRYRSLPPVEFGYQELLWNIKVETIAPEDVANAPAGLSSGYQWVDLYNEGISGILTEQGEGWFYKENLGDGHFTVAKPVIPKPSLMGISTGVLQLQDLEADGRKQVVVNSPGLDGYFELTEDNGWGSFRAFTQIPNVDLRDPNTRLLDLNGDGQPEIVITEDNAFTWYPAAGVKGYDAPEWTHKPFDEEQGPAIVFADSTQSIFLADMSGDGLTDIARIRNGEVCYWPNLGYGRFGAKVTMGNSPWFDAPDLFNPAYLQLADISGTGATDLLYLGKNRFRAWLNLSGNAWSAPCDIDPFPATAQPNAVTVTDLLGNGTACIVWSSPLPANAQAPLRYIDLMGGQKPHVLNTYKNNLGKETRWTYKSSTHFYLEDKQAGKPWITKLPFPVQVVRMVTVTDQWRKSSFSNTYSYHHGYYDHPEREFRGFGRVEQVDAESFGTFASGNAASPYITDDLTLYQPPVKTITWFHTGAFLSRERILNQFAEEYFQPNGGGFHENELPEPDLEAAQLSAIEWREALRACKGLTLRQEVYELEVDALERDVHVPLKLFSTAFHNCHIQRIQKRGGNQFAVFLVTESEAVTYHYELALQDGVPLTEADPRIVHTLNLRIDELGNVLESGAIGYPRWSEVEMSDDLLPENTGRLIYDVQHERHIAYTESQFTNDVITAADYRLRVPCEVKTYELTGLTPESGFYFNLEELRDAQIAGSVEAIEYHQLPNRISPQKRLVEQVRMLYFDENLSDPLTFTHLNRLGLPYETYKIALTEELLTAILGDKLPSLRQDDEAYPTMLARVLGEGGYFPFPDEPGTWWIRSGIAGFAEDAAAHFYLPERYTDPFGNETTLHFDVYDLYLDSSTDPVGNTMQVVRFDFRVLAPLEMRDINDNQSEVVYDTLGIPAAVAVKGKGAEGDNLENVPLELSEADLIAFFTGEYQEDVARELLGNATARHLYFLGSETHPACACGIVRESHLAEAGNNSPIQVAFEYSDGMGAVLVKKVQAEPAMPGGPLRWIASGKTILNNKGKPVKQYEPYFSPTGHRFEEPQDIGVTPILYYDAVGRQVRTELPDGAYSRVEFSPWHAAAYDPNDTVLESGNIWYNRYTGPDATAEMRRAAQLAATHANTPSLTHLDSLGRDVMAMAHNRTPDEQGVAVDEKYVTFTRLDAEGKPLWIRDARNNLVMRYTVPSQAGADPTLDFYPAYDLAGNLLFQHSMDAGDRWMLPDSAGQPIYSWDNRDNLLHARYDALRRPLATQLRNTDHSDWITVAYTQYGDENGLALPAAERIGRQQANWIGQPYRVCDQSGVITNPLFDFKGNLLESHRRLSEAFDTDTDWTSTIGLSFTGEPAGLLPETFTQRTQYDALNRMTRQENWHREGIHLPPVYQPSYNRRGSLENETLTVNGQETRAIESITYDAKGQRDSIHYGNQTNTHYTYDSLTFRLVNLRTTGPSGVFQDLSYTYDPSGNITEINDAAQEILYFRNRRVEPRCRYTYDALYRLISAEGREHMGQNADSAQPTPADPWAGFHGNHAQPGDGNAMGTYLQHYGYDAVGNILFIRHQNRTDAHLGYTRYYQYATASNRLLATGVGQDAPATHYTDAPILPERYDYNIHGSMTRMPHLPAMDWDFTEHLSHISIFTHPDSPPSVEAWYRYDASKQRSRKRVLKQGGLVEERYYLGGMEWYRRYGAGDEPVEEIETHHLFAGDQRVLIVEDVLVTDSDLPVGVLFRYQYSNHLGSVGIELDGAGEIISYEEYHPYGTTAYHAVNAAIRAVAKRYRYTGMERDEESGLAYHMARYYLPWLGRWGSCDPLSINAGINLYRYASSNSINKSDKEGTQDEPSGRFTYSYQPFESGTTIRQEVGPMVEDLRTQLGIPSPRGWMGRGERIHRIDFTRIGQSGDRLLVAEILSQMSNPRVARQIRSQLDALRTTRHPVDSDLILAIAYRETEGKIFSFNGPDIFSYGESGLDRLYAIMGDLRKGGYIPEGFGSNWRDAGGGSAWIPRNEIIVAFGAAINRAQDIFYREAHNLGLDTSRLSQRARRAWTMIFFNNPTIGRSTAPGGVSILMQAKNLIEQNPALDLNTALLHEDLKGLSVPRNQEQRYLGIDIVQRGLITAAESNVLGRFRRRVTPQTVIVRERN